MSTRFRTAIIAAILLIAIVALLAGCSMSSKFNGLNGKYGDVEMEGKQRDAGQTNQQNLLKKHNDNVAQIADALKAYNQRNPYLKGLTGLSDLHLSDVNRVPYGGGAYRINIVGAGTAGAVVTVTPAWASTKDGLLVKPTEGSSSQVWPVFAQQ